MDFFKKWKGSVVEELDQLFTESLRPLDSRCYKYTKKVVNDSVTGTIFKVDPTAKNAPPILFHTFQESNIIDVEIGKGFKVEVFLPKSLSGHRRCIALLRDWIQAALQGLLTEDITYIGAGEYRVKAFLNANGKTYTSSTRNVFELFEDHSEDVRTVRRLTYENYE
jgi:hypothetical protein